MTRREALQNCRHVIEEVKNLMAGGFSATACEAAGYGHAFDCAGEAAVKSLLDRRLARALAGIDQAERDANIPLVKIGQGDFERCLRAVDA